MFGFLKSRIAGKKTIPFVLGPLEMDVMEVVWSQESCNVRDVTTRLARPLAYTTVMTTLDRLYKKGMLERRKIERAFEYSAALSRSDWERRQAGDLVSGLLANPRHSNELLISSLVDVVGEHDVALLDELERKIRLKRKAGARRPS